MSVPGDLVGEPRILTAMTRSGVKGEWLSVDEDLAEAAEMKDLASTTGVSASSPLIILRFKKRTTLWI